MLSTTLHTRQTGRRSGRWTRRTSRSRIAVLGGQRAMGFGPDPETSRLGAKWKENNAGIRGAQVGRVGWRGARGAKGTRTQGGWSCWRTVEKGKARAEAGSIDVSPVLMFSGSELPRRSADGCDSRTTLGVPLNSERVGGRRRKGDPLRLGKSLLIVYRLALFVSSRPQSLSSWLCLISPMY